jgi:hypothetical protein
MDAITSVIANLQASQAHLSSKEITLAKLLIKQSIDDLKLFMSSLESDGAQTADGHSRSTSDDLTKSIIVP